MPKHVNTEPFLQPNLVPYEYSPDRRKYFEKFYYYKSSQDKLDFFWWLCWVKRLPESWSDHPNLIARNCYATLKVPKSEINFTIKKVQNGHFWPPGQKIGQNHEHRPNLVHFWWLKVILIVVSFLGQKWGFSAILAHFGRFGPFIGPKSKKTCFIPFIYALGSPHKEEFKICDFWVVGSYSP